MLEKWDMTNARKKAQGVQLMQLSKKHSYLQIRIKLDQQKVFCGS